MSLIERSEWTIYEGDGEHPAQPLVWRGQGKPDIEGWKRIEVVPAEQLRGSVEDRVERGWYQLGLQLVEDDLLPVGAVTDGLREKLKRALRAALGE
jgi:hypothetical protein